AISFMAATIGATLIGGPVAGFGVAFAVEGSNAYEDALDDGATQEQAEIEGFVVGGINAALELLQIERVIKFAKAGKGSIKQIVKAAREKALKRLAKKAGKITKAGLKLSITEGVQEALQETTSVLAPGLTGRELPPISEAVKRIGQAGLGGAVAGPILGGAGAVGGAIIDRPRIPGEPEPTREIPPISEAIKGMKPIEEAERPAPEAKVAEKPEITAPTEAVKPEIARKPIPEQVVTPETEKAGPLTEAQSLAKELEKSLKLSPERALRVAKKKLILDAQKEIAPTEAVVSVRRDIAESQNVSVEEAVIFRDMNIRNFEELIDRKNIDDAGTFPSKTFYANTPSLALGQKGNTGVLIEFKATNDLTQNLKISKAKPGQEFVRAQGQFELSGITNSKTMFDNIKSVTLSPETAKSIAKPVRALGGKPIKNRFQKLVDNLEKQGWTKEVLEDGSVKYTQIVPEA
ncbi:hypothetical protein LCGC14_2606990, partial [marine sediment metagenome]